MPPPPPHWQQQHEHLHQHKQQRHRSHEHQQDQYQHRERGRKLSRGVDKKEKSIFPREVESTNVKGDSYSGRHKRNGSYPDLTQLPPPDFRSLPHAHADSDRHRGQERKQRDKEKYPNATKVRASNGNMRRSRTTSMTAASEGVSRHQQTSMIQTEEDKQTRRHHSHHHGTHHYPTIPGDRVHFDTLEPYAAKLHQQLQHELKSELGGRRRSRSVSITSRERSIERSIREQRHRHHRKKDKEYPSTADRPISPPAQFSLPSTAYAASTSENVINTSARKPHDPLHPANQNLPILTTTRTDDSKNKTQKLFRPSQHYSAHHSSSQVPTQPKPSIVNIKPSLQERYSSSFSSHQIPPPLPSQGSGVAQHKSKLRAKDKRVAETDEDIHSILSSNKRQLHHTHEHFHQAPEDSLQHICGMDTASLQFQTDPKESQTKIPKALKPQPLAKHRSDAPSEHLVESYRAPMRDRKNSESGSYFLEEKQNVSRGKDKIKHLTVQEKSTELPPTFAHPYEHYASTRLQYDEGSPDKDQLRDETSKRRHKQKMVEEEEEIRNQRLLEEEQMVKREREERDRRIARRILEKQKEAKAMNEKLKREQDIEREKLSAEMREKERIAKEMANQERKAIEKAERDRREKMKLATKLQQERDEERRSQRSRLGRDTNEPRLTRRLSKDLPMISSKDSTYVKGDYVDNIDFVSETTRLLVPPDDESKRERSWDRKSRKSYDSAPPLEDAKSQLNGVDDHVKRPSTMPDTTRPQSDSHRHNVIVHSKEVSTYDGRGDRPDVFTSGIITHDQPLHLREPLEDASKRPRSLISLLPPPSEGDKRSKSSLNESHKRNEIPRSPPCECEYEKDQTAPESDSGNHETVLEAPVSSHQFPHPLTTPQHHDDDVDVLMQWDRRSRESKGSRPSKASQGARSQGYASHTSSVFIGDKMVSKAETVVRRTDIYGADDDVMSHVESVELCITTDDQPSMITPSVLGDIVTTDDGRRSPSLVQYRPRSHSKSRHHKAPSVSKDHRRPSSGHRDHNYYQQQQQQRQYGSHSVTPKSKHRKYKSHHPEGSEFGYDSRCDMYGLESDYEIEQHIRNCPCPCDHLGYGNYRDYQVRTDAFILFCVLLEL